MKRIIPGLLRRSRFGLIMVALACLPACLAGQNIGGAKGSGVESHPYVYNRPHHVPDDYIYRTERIISAPGQPPFPWKATASTAQGGPQGSVPATSQENASQLVQTVRDLVAQLLRVGNDSLEEDQRVLVSSFVNLNDLYKTSALGRMLGEQMVSELQRSGIEVLDVRKSPNLLIRQRLGEFGLSRDIEEIPYIHEAYATVVGTYSAADSQLFINARILRNSDGLVIGSASKVLAENPLLSSLLEDEAEPVDRRMDTVQVEVQ